MTSNQFPVIVSRVAVGQGAREYALALVLLTSWRSFLTCRARHELARESSALLNVPYTRLLTLHAL
jgi:hypothetical protein